MTSLLPRIARPRFALLLLAAFASSALAGESAGAGSNIWWSFRPLVRAVPPDNGAQHPIDSFIVDKLQAAGLELSPEATRRSLVRRLYFDLLGLPPSPEEVRDFLEDGRPRAYEDLVDRLLASPHYGERWARHWLDVAHYGDTHGYDKDQPRPDAWPYRDYVIRALNEDKPYWRFVQEQIAGDALFPGTTDGIEALGFISAGPWDLIGHAEVPETKIDGKIARHLDRDDMVANTMSAFNSLTVHCAQCHDHKFDPISSEDYYSLQAVFAALDRTTREYYSDPALTARRDSLKALERALRKEQTNELASLQKEIGAMPKPRRAFIGAVHYGSGAFRGAGPDGGAPRPIYVLARGDVRKPGKLAEPGALSCIEGLPARFTLPSGADERDRRKALALWLTDPSHPITWRSIVNRVWQHHFGRGLVDTPNDFGRMGSRPSHPELLDWLAAEFRDGGQSLKRLHRLIVTSQAYRQGSSAKYSQRAEELDKDNRLLWRMNRRKLEAEALRDAVLAVSGRLQRQMFGPGFQDFVVEKPEHSPHYQYHLHDPDDPRSHRRSIYRFIVRSQQQPFMASLDCADPSMMVDRRNESVSALQALALLNNGFMLAMADHFAEKLGRDCGSLEDRVRRAFEEALGREPGAVEQADLADFARAHGLPNACRVLFNLNEFAFVD